MLVEWDEVLEVHEVIYMALGGHEHAKKAAQQRSAYIVFWASEYVDDATGMVMWSSLKNIYEFDQRARGISQFSPGKRIMFSTGLDPLLQYKISFLVGCHLIMSLDVDLEKTISAFKKLDALFRSFSSSDKFIPTVHSCWSALCQTKSMHWIDFLDFPPASCMDMDAYSHYSCPLNGEVFTVIPNKLLLFASPTTLPADGAMWQDIDRQRCFSHGFYADLLQDLGVTIVVALDNSGRSQAAGAAITLVTVGTHAADYRTRGIDVCSQEDLRGGQCSESSSSECISMEMLDRFIAMIAAPPGGGAVAVAVPAQEGHGGLASTLMAIYLMTRLGGTANEASAWLHMACPGRVDYLASRVAMVSAATVGLSALDSEAEWTVCNRDATDRPRTHRPEGFGGDCEEEDPRDTVPGPRGGGVDDTGRKVVCVESQGCGNGGQQVRSISNLTVHLWKPLQKLLKL